jgi:hypothetical protein
MKIYRNNTKSPGNAFAVVFSIFTTVVVLLCVINEIKYNEYKFTILYLIIIAPVIFFIISFHKNYYGKIKLDKNKFYINKIFYNQRLLFYNIIKIEEPYIMTIDEIIFLFPEEKKFWIELNKAYYNYRNVNKKYFCKADDIYKKLFSIMMELNEEKFGEKKRHAAKRLPIFIVYFVWLKYLIKFIRKHSLYNDYFDSKKELKKYINEYKSKPNFA